MNKNNKTVFVRKRDKEVRRTRWNGPVNYPYLHPNMAHKLPITRDKH